MNKHEQLIAVITLAMLDEGYTIHDVMKIMKNIAGDVWHGWVDEKRKEG